MPYPLAAARSKSPYPGPWWDPYRRGYDVHSAHRGRGAVSKAESYRDLTGQGNHLIEGSALNWQRELGWEFREVAGIPDPVNPWLVSNFVPASDQSQTIMMEFTDNSGAAAFAGIVEIIYDPGPIIGLFGLGTEVATATYQNGGTSHQVAPFIASGNLAVAGNKGYRNGVEEAGTIPPWPEFTPSLPCFVGASNANGVAMGFGEFNGVGIVFFRETLPAEEVMVVRTAMAGL